ncbi:MAG: hypothetical protein RMY29_033025 [Nostoc sp. CreGUA01]|nr:hypothetical protein [Nostoc sp. CreGUA01]
MGHGAWGIGYGEKSFPLCPLSPAPSSPSSPSSPQSPFPSPYSAACTLPR